MSIPSIERTSRLGIIDSNSPIQDGGTELVETSLGFRQRIDKSQALYRVSDELIIKQSGNGHIYKFGGNEDSLEKEFYHYGKVVAFEPY